ncbi:MAG: pyrimidine dimer DNA glycosylase/endonuclease V [Actinomycetaceae bacterium]|nr:pyrimidine dimer DNA glycosylase/endonuclease V [Actinomycetaceae bacterium]
MRLWSIHPRYLDRPGLLGAWREALLAQKVLAGKTRGYINHPQLQRFRETDNPAAAIGQFLSAIADEADARGYRFDRRRITHPDEPCDPIPVTRGQLDYEWSHLLAKLDKRSADLYRETKHRSPQLHPLFVLVDGPIADWERPLPS